MENFLIIDDVDTCYIEQNSWLILLQKQIARNYYLLKYYEKDKSSKKLKLDPKQLYHRLKSSINRHIKQKIKHKKLSQKKLQPNDNLTSVTLRRKTQQLHKKTLLKIFNQKDPENNIKQRYFTSQQLHSSSENHQNTKNLNRIYPQLPFSQSSQITQGNYKNLTTLKKQSKILTQKRQKINKFLSHTKPILSLHDLELNTKDIIPSQETAYQKRLTQIQKILLKSSKNSPKKETCKNSFIVKKSVEQLPLIGRLDCKTLPISVYGKKDERISCFMPQSFPYQKQSVGRSQQTKQSECDFRGGLESILEYYVRSRKKEKEEGFEDSHISQQSVKNYRISKVKNLKLSVH